MACCGAQLGAFADSGRESHPASAEAARIPAVRCRASRRSIGGARFFVRSATPADLENDDDLKPRTQIGEVGGKVLGGSLPDPRSHPAHAHLAEVLEARHVLLAEEVAVVESACTLLAVARAVEEETRASASRHACDPLAQVEQERDLLASVQRALGVVPAVPGQRGGDAASPPQLVGEPEGERSSEVEDPQRVASRRRQLAQEALEQHVSSFAPGHARDAASIVMGGGEGRGAKPGLEGADAASPRQHGGERPCLGDGASRHQLPRKFMAPTMTAASTMKRPSSSRPSMRLSASSSAEKSRGSSQSYTLKKMRTRAMLITVSTSAQARLRVDWMAASEMIASAM